MQYLDWLQRAIAGDLGKSYYFRTDVSTLIGERLPTTMMLGVSAITFAIVFSVPLGVAAAIRPNSIIDRVALFLSVMGQALPSFWFALMLIIFLSVNLRLLPTSGSDTWLHFRYANCGTWLLCGACHYEVNAHWYARGIEH